MVMHACIVVMQTDLSVGSFVHSLCSYVVIISNWASMYGVLRILTLFK